jgi:hypothetical protein
MELNRQSGLLEEREKELKKEFMDGMKAENILKLQGALCDVEIKDDQPAPTVRSWELFYKHILETGAFELLQKRLSATAIREHWETGEHIPGVDKYPVLRLAVTNKQPL